MAFDQAVPKLEIHEFRRPLRVADGEMEGRRLALPENERAFDPAQRDPAQDEAGREKVGLDGQYPAGPDDRPLPFQGAGPLERQVEIIGQQVGRRPEADPEIAGQIIDVRQNPPRPGQNGLALEGQLMEPQFVSRPFHGDAHPAVHGTAHGGEKNRALGGVGLENEAALGLAKKGPASGRADVDVRAPEKDLAVRDEPVLHRKRQPQVELFRRSGRSAFVNVQDGFFDDDRQRLVAIEKR